MFKKILIAAGIIAAAFTMQAPAQAGGKFAIGFSSGFGGGHGFHGGSRVGFQKFHHGGRRGFNRHHRGNRGFNRHNRGFNKNHGIVHKKKHFVKPHHSGVQGRKHYVKPHHVSKKGHHLSNKQLRRSLRHHGLYNIRFVDRHHGVAKLVAHNKRGYIGRYKVDTRSGHILSGRKIRNF